MESKMGTREQDAYHAYLNLLEQKGLPQADLDQRKFVLSRLMLYIENIPSDGLYYRRAVDKYFKRMSEAELAMSVPVIRDYFSFWIKDIKAIAAMNQDHEFETDSHDVRPAMSNLKSLWKSLDKLTLTETEMQPLETYEHSLRSRGVDDKLVSTQKKLAKLLLLRLRDVPHKQPNAYRRVIDANLALFHMEEAHQAFLKVGREFYGFWRGHLVAQQNHAGELALAA
jgi:hypothetical protein